MRNTKCVFFTRGGIKGTADQTSSCQHTLSNPKGLFGTFKRYTCVRIEIKHLYPCINAIIKHRFSYPCLITALIHRYRCFNILSPSWADFSISTYIYQKHENIFKKTTHWIHAGFSYHFFRTWWASHCHKVEKRHCGCTVNKDW